MHNPCHVQPWKKPKRYVKHQFQSTFRQGTTAQPAVLTPVVSIPNRLVLLQARLQELQKKGATSSQLLAEEVKAKIVEDEDKLVSTLPFGSLSAEEEQEIFATCNFD